LNSLPVPFCGKIDLMKADLTPVLTVQTQNCTISNTTGFSARGFVSGYSVYYAQMRAWYANEE